jgi:hypothetical protein
MKLSQLKRIENWILPGRTLTPIQALNKFKCFRLGARIHELRSKYKIIDIKGDGCYAKYFLAGLKK